jgi:hypothetical protein
MHNLIDELLYVLNNKTYSGVFFCDLLTAFNCVTHDILPLPFNVHGIQRHSWAMV